MSLYASAEGVLYRSYDTFVGNTGFYDGNDDSADMYYGNSSGHPESSGQVHQFGSFLQNGPQGWNQPFQQNPQQILVTHPGQNFHASCQPLRYNISNGHAVNGFISQSENVSPQRLTSHGQGETGGVGIKFGERMDPDTNGFIVFVKRLIRGGPAEGAACIRPGDLLVTLQDRDVRGQGLVHLREHILGPAGTLARMGFLAADGSYYVCDIVRSAYREAPPPATAVYPAQPHYHTHGGAGFIPRQTAPPIQSSTIAVAIRRPDILRPAPPQQRPVAASAYASAGSAPRAPQAYTGGPEYYAGGPAAHAGFQPTGGAFVRGHPAVAAAAPPASLRPPPAARHVEPWLQPPPAATRQPLGPGTPPRAAPAPHRLSPGERFSPGRRPDEYLDRGYTQYDAQPLAQYGSGGLPAGGGGSYSRDYMGAQAGSQGKAIGSYEHAGSSTGSGNGGVYGGAGYGSYVGAESGGGYQRDHSDSYSNAAGYAYGGGYSNGGGGDYANYENMDYLDEQDGTQV